MKKMDGMTESTRMIVHVRLGASRFPFGVVLNRTPPRTSTMQALARKSGLEIAFLVPSSFKSTSRRYTLRWFSPHGEMQLCGAGALAAAKFVFQHTENKARVAFDTPSGQLAAHRKNKQVSVRLPHAVLHPFTPDPVLIGALGVEKPEHALVALRHQTVMLCLHTVEQVESAQPNFSALRALHLPHLGAVILTASGRLAHAVFRYFTPWHGKDESAVAGSALSGLGPYWAAQCNQSQLHFRQASRAGAHFVARVEKMGVWLTENTCMRD